MVKVLLPLVILPMKYASQLSDYGDKTMKMKKTLALLVSSAFVFVAVAHWKTRSRMRLWCEQ